MTDIAAGSMVEVDVLHAVSLAGSVGKAAQCSAGSVGPMGRDVEAPPRTLADQLRRWPDERLAELLRVRPDLATPAPHDSGQLASRAATRSSIFRALESLNRLELTVLDALVVQSQTTSDELVSIVHADETATRAALDRVLDLALAWDAPGGLRPLSGVADALRGDEAGGVSGLRPRSPDACDVTNVSHTIEQLSPAGRALLDHVMANGGEGRTGNARRVVHADDARSPAEELIARGLLRPREDGVFVLPGEVGLALRGGHTTIARADDVPDIATTARDQSMVDALAAGAAFEFVRRVELLLDQWGLAPPGVLRSGGLGVRDLRAAAAALHVEPSEAALIIETTVETGLLAAATGPDENEVWVPTDAFDAWSAAELGQRWLVLAQAWLDSPRIPSLVGARDAGGKAWNALAPELSSPLAPDARRLALSVLAGLPPGSVLAAGTGVPSVADRVAWLRPRRPSMHRDLVAAGLAESAALGLTGAGGLTSYARALIAGDGSDAARGLSELLPAPVDHVLLQADLTAVAAGPLETEMARTLHLLADVESRGGATVYRFTADSVRRALDAGWSALEVHDYISSVSATPVPQALSYLVDDVARTFGTIRVGAAEAFLRADDDAALTELLHHPKASSLGLRRLAPTVVISTVPLDLLVPRLRELGAAPVVEAPDGTVRVARRDLLRARKPKTSHPRAAAQAKAEATVAAVVNAIRSGDRAGAGRPSEGRTTTPSAALAALREAIEARTDVVIGYVGNDGAASERLVEPRRLDGGRLTAYDRRADAERHFAVHRITGVRAAS